MVVVVYDAIVPPPLTVPTAGSEDTTFTVTIVSSLAGKTWSRAWLS